MNTKIFVMTHKKFNSPQDLIYVPLHVGRALGGDLGYLGDDTGDSISELNPYYGELTGLYWLWKNENELTENDIIGICHYRRYFCTENKKIMKQSDFEKVLEQSDIMVSNAMYAPGTYKDYYGEAHNLQDLLAAGEVIKELYPEDYAVFCQMIEDNKFYYGNLCVTRKKIFDEYCAWLFSIFFELSKRVDVSDYDNYHKRLFGFLSEELLRVFITARNLRVTEGHIGLTSEKAETVELKLAMSQLVKLGQFKEAREMFYQYLKIRPDVRLEGSDIKGEMPDIEQILYILEQEQERGQETFYAVSHQLNDLIIHLRTIRSIIQKEHTGQKPNKKEQEYLKATKVTELAKEIIRINL